MGKDIVLPWSCETHDKIKTLIKWIMQLGFPLGVILLLVENNLDDLNVLLFIIGGVGTLFMWTRQIVDWYYDDKFPSFRCKCDNDINSKESRS
jgi:hypothetical protein